jgi:hypothetical protein
MHRAHAARPGAGIDSLPSLDPDPGRCPLSFSAGSSKTVYTQVYKFLSSEGAGKECVNRSFASKLSRVWVADRFVRGAHLSTK